MVRPAHAFTLVELVVVMILIAILSATAALSLKPILARRELDRAIGQIRMNDAAARATARRWNTPAEIKIERRSGRAEYKCGDQRRQFKLPSRTTIKQVVGVAPSTPFVVTRDGRSASYAVAISIDEATRWIVVVGGSGQTLTVDSAREVGNLVGAKP